MRYIWRIGKRKFDSDWDRSLWLFDRMVWIVMDYGVEIYGWKKRNELDSLEEKWLMGANGNGREDTRLFF